MNVVIYLPVSKNKFQTLKNGQNMHVRKRQPGKERQIERIKTGYDIRFFVEGDTEEKEGVCVRRVRKITKTDTTIEFNLEPLSIT